MLSTSLPKFCPKKSCPCFQSTENKITKDGVYYLKTSGEKRQMFYCHGGQHRFSEMSYSDLINKKGTDQEYRQTFKLINYGLSAEQIADVLEKDPRTIEVWIQARREADLFEIAEKSKNFRAFCLSVNWHYNRISSKVRIMVLSQKQKSATLAIYC